MEKLTSLIIYLHAGLGGVALLAGLVSIIAKKGLRTHKLSGLVFFYSMLVSVAAALIISLLPGHKSPFLFAIGILSLYFIFSGKRALRFKFRNPNLLVDKCISATMLATSILMIILPIIISSSINIVLATFGAVALIFSVRDLISFSKPENLMKDWLRIHLGKMLGGYIAATTAFVVVNNFFTGIYGWFVPGLIGGALIIYWFNKLNKKSVRLSS